jgi:glutamine synthetase
MGYRFNLGIETEFFILKDTEDGALHRSAIATSWLRPCYDLTGLLDNYKIG